MPRGKRRWQPREIRLVAEWLANRWADRETMQRVRVGAIHPDLIHPDLSPAEQRAASNWRRWVDAIVFDPPRLLVVEGKIIAQPGDVSQLTYYCRLVPHTPELADHSDLDVQGVLLYAVTDPTVTALAVEAGLEVVEYHPTWVADYLAELFPREGQPSLTWPPVAGER